MSKWEEKYKGIEDVDVEDEKYKEKSASAIYYGEIMGSLLSEMQNGIDKAVEVYEKTKNEYEEPYIKIYIDEGKTKIDFSFAIYDEDECEYTSEKTFFTYNVGEIMEEALFLMTIMEKSDYGTSMGQAINNWVEDLGFDGFGEFDENYAYSDSWDLIQY